jgi:uncharacterized metal-binding protein YceD (DUF177 family)
MQIPFRKIGKVAQKFELKSDLLTFKGTLRYDSSSLLELHAQLEGEILLQCDICAEEFTEHIDEELEFFISDGAYSGEELDVVEATDSIVDLDEILNSEIELIKNDYHRCSSCS